jgi:hypothetical protein
MATKSIVDFTGLSFLSSDRTAPAGVTEVYKAGRTTLPREGAGRRGKGSRPPPGKVVVWRLRCQKTAKGTPLQPPGNSPDQFGPLSRAVLAALWQLERTTSVDELAAHLRIEVATLEPVLREMEARGLVTLDPDTEQVARLPHPRNPAA